MSIRSFSWSVWVVIKASFVNDPVWVSMGLQPVMKKGYGYVIELNCDPFQAATPIELIPKEYVQLITCRSKVDGDLAMGQTTLPGTSARVALTNPVRSGRKEYTFDLTGSAQNLSDLQRTIELAYAS